MDAPNDAELLKIFTRVPPGLIAQNYVSSDAEFEVVIHAEVGIALLAMQMAYKILVIVRDLTDGTTVTTFKRQGFLGDENWPAQFVSHPFPLSPQGRAKQDHVYEAIAALVVGPDNPIVDFLESNLFIIM